jgi:hypothetical protein
LAESFLATVLYSWLSQYAHLAVWLWPLLLVFAIVGIQLGALVAYFMLMFVLFWLAPNSPLLVESEVASPTAAQRGLFPLFHAARKLARWLAPKPS